MNKLFIKITLLRSYKEQGVGKGDVKGLGNYKEEGVGGRVFENTVS